MSATSSSYDIRKERVLTCLLAERLCKEQWDSNNVTPKDKGGFGRPCVIIACSALKKWYRDILRGHVEAIPPPVDDLVSDRRPAFSCH